MGRAVGGSPTKRLRLVGSEGFEAPPLSRPPRVGGARPPGRALRQRGRPPCSTSCAAIPRSASHWCPGFRTSRPRPGSPYDTRWPARSPTCSIDAPARGCSHGTPPSAAAADVAALIAPDLGWSDEQVTAEVAAYRAVDHGRTRAVDVIRRAIALTALLAIALVGHAHDGGGQEARAADHHHDHDVATAARDEHHGVVVRLRTRVRVRHALGAGRLARARPASSSRSRSCVIAPRAPTRASAPSSSTTAARVRAASTTCPACGPASPRPIRARFDLVSWDPVAPARRGPSTASTTRPSTSR